jgi:predicted MFS family arabinose efflux permease
VMGVVQTAFSASQVLGVPAGIYLANVWSWHAAFLALIVVASPIGLVILLFMKPVSAHLALKQESSPWAHLVDTVVVPRHLLAFAATGRSRWAARRPK